MPNGLTQIPPFGQQPFGQQPLLRRREPEPQKPRQFTREEIRQKAFQLEKAGAPSSDIENFVSLASQNIKPEPGLIEKGRQAIGRAFREREPISPFAFPKFAARTAVETARGIGREAVRPFVSVARGLQRREEPVKVPLLGEVKPLTELTPGEALLGALEVSALSPTAVASAGFSTVKTGKEVVTRPTRVFRGKLAARKETLEQTVSPKVTPKRKEALIKKEPERIKKGEKVPLLGKAPDIIEPGVKEKTIAQTFRRLIPGAEKLDEFRLVERANEKIGDIADTVRGELKVVKFTPKNRTQLFDEWTNIKKKQQGNVFFGTRAKRFQNEFERILDATKKKLKDPQTGQFRDWTMEDLWDMRIAYDNLDSVKSVKSLRPGATAEEAFLHNMWKENRNALNQFMKDEINALGGDLASNFKDMSNLYDGINNIATKGNIDLVGEPNVINKFLQIVKKPFR